VQVSDATLLGHVTAIGHQFPHRSSRPPRGGIEIPTPEAAQVATLVEGVASLAGLEGGNWEYIAEPHGGHRFGGRWISIEEVCLIWHNEHGGK
jgi:hypothetical protein